MFSLRFKKFPLKKMETPQRVFESLRSENAVLMESASAERGGAFERYSFVGYEPFLLFHAKDSFNTVTTFSYHDEDIEEESSLFEGDSLQFFQQLNEAVRIDDVPNGMPPFIGGAVGYMSYDFGESFFHIMPRQKDELDIPDMLFAFFDKVIAWDHHEQVLYVCALGETEKQAEKILGEMSERREKMRSPESRFVEKKKRHVSIASNFSAKEYVKKVQRIRELLHDGETYQVNFSQRFSVQSDRDSFQLYRSLATLNPSPMACFFDFPDMPLISMSPERLISCRDNVLETRPIKGTVRRGKNAREDERLVAELLASEKDDAELSMIVDLARNDLGQVSKPGTVRVVEHRAPEKYSHVIHTVSTVRGQKLPGADFVDVMRAVFPGGSITGCPKKRTMEIIDQLETVRRDVYCGSAGYVSASGNFDMNILIRSLVYRDGVYYFHAGGGVVMDSDPKKEYEESLQKAQAMVDMFHQKI